MWRREDVPDCVLAFGEGLEALSCHRVPDAAVYTCIGSQVLRKGWFLATYINPSQAHETSRLESRLKCTAVT